MTFDAEHRNAGHTAVDEVAREKKSVDAHRGRQDPEHDQDYVEELARDAFHRAILRQALGYAARLSIRARSDASSDADLAEFLLGRSQASLLRR